ncbi:MAG TPA: DUF6458 family protein [Nocardioidaceae bacterium]|nr:DUF6458 family protein [Actinomycetota bacterium]MDQ3423885.1 DUF6458 family protein [Actinomycetota bacterium]HEV8055688.1 DUF6458 family protein [Nocardioidaceae bacterium]
MGIGLGVVLLVIGLILALDVLNVGTTFVDEGPLGWILVAAGVLAIILAFVMNAQRNRKHTVEERRYDST